MKNNLRLQQPTTSGCVPLSPGEGLGVRSTNGQQQGWYTKAGSWQMLLLLFLVFTTTASAQPDSINLFCYFKNNGKDGLHLACSKDGFKWQALFNDTAILPPQVGKDKLMRDPCIIQGPDGLYHLVWTTSWTEKGIGHASSKDLFHWSPQQFIPLLPNDSAINCWAPEMAWDKKEKQYVIYWASTIPGKFPETDSSGDGKYNHRLYYVTTKDFKTFGPAKLLYDKGFTVIDATIKEQNGTYIMFLKDETKLPVARKNICIATSKNLTGDYTTPSAPITGNYWAEGPTVLQLGPQWIVYFDKYRDHKYGAITSTDLQHWTDVSDKLTVPSGLRHGTVFRISQKEFKRYFGAISGKE